MLHTTDGGETWVQQAPRYFHEMIKGIVFLNETEGWVVGWPGIIFHTRDGGLTWKRQNSNSYNELYAVYFIDRHTGWVVGQFGEILQTLDGGKTWKFQRSGTQANLNKVYFADANHGLIVGDEGVILTTINGGVTWELQKGGTSNDLYSFSLSPDGILAVGEGGIAMRYSVDTEKFIVELPPAAEEVAAALEAQLPETVEYHWEIIRSGALQTYFTDTYFLSALRGWTVGHDGVILKTTDGGKTWHPQQSGVTEDLQRIHFIDEQHGWIGGKEVLLRTENGGQTWQRVGKGLENVFFISAMHFITPKKGWIGVNNGQTLHTTDGGKTWHIQKTGLTQEPITDFYFISSQQGWAVAPQRRTGGFILHTVDGGNYWDIQARTHHRGIGIHFANAQLGWVVMENGDSLTTTDGGQTWKLRRGQMASGTRLQAVKIRNHTQAWAVANQKTLLTTDNQGESWTQRNGALGNKEKANAETESWVHRIAADEFYTPFNLTNAHILENGQGWVVGGFTDAPHPTGDFTVDAIDADRGQTVAGQIYNTFDFGKTWHPQLGEPSKTFRDVFFLDEKHGWIAGDNGTLIATEDSGKTWHPLETHTRKNFIDIHFVSLEPRWGWAMLRDGTLLYTSEAETWTRGGDTDTTRKPPEIPGTFSLNDVAFGKLSEGWAVGENGNILHNPDGGAIWKHQQTSTGKTLTSVDMKFAPLGWAVGTNGVIQRTINGGEYWKFHETQSGYDLYAVSFITKRKGWAAGRAGIILSTTDGGFTWQAQSSGVSETLYDILALSENEIYAVGASGTIIHSTDGGETWEQEHTGINDNLYVVTRVKDSDTLWAVGQLGVILRRPKR